MLIPRFSMRWLLLALGGASLLAFAARQAVFGESWGLAVMVTVGALAMMFTTYVFIFAGTFLVATLVSLLFRGRPAPESPFASAKAPPQVIAPTSPDLDE